MGFGGFHWCWFLTRRGAQHPYLSGFRVFGVGCLVGVFVFSFQFRCMAHIYRAMVCGSVFQHGLCVVALIYVREGHCVHGWRMVCCYCSFSELVTHP